jgi:hypothetical protein
MARVAVADDAAGPRVLRDQLVVVVDPRPVVVLIDDDLDLDPAVADVGDLDLVEPVAVQGLGHAVGGIEADLDRPAVGAAGAVGVEKVEPGAGELAPPAVISEGMYCHAEYDHASVPSGLSGRTVQRRDIGCRPYLTLER